MPKLILQRFGIGDCIFSMSAIRKLNDKIIWPVMSHYVDDLNRAYPDIFFIDSKLVNIDYNRKDQYNIIDLTVIPLAWQDSPVKDCMKNKYQFFGFDWTQWKMHAYYHRDKLKEVALFKHLGLEPGEEYNLISETFQCDFGGSKKIQVNNGLKNVYVRQIPGYSLFDWSTVFEEATNIHVVSSSNIYIMELLKLKAKDIKIYRREPKEKDHSNYDYILTSHNYILE